MDSAACTLVKARLPPIHIHKPGPSESVPLIRTMPQTNPCLSIQNQASANPYLFKSIPQRIPTFQIQAPANPYLYSSPGPSKSIPLFKSRPLRIYTSIQIQAQANPYLYSNPGPSESMPVKSRTQQIRIFSNPGLSESIPI